MHAIFMAKGPLFATRQRLPAFNTVDLFNLFCMILQIDCIENEGTNRTDAWKMLLTNRNLLQMNIIKLASLEETGDGVAGDRVSLSDILSQRVSDKRKF